MKRTTSRARALFEEAVEIASAEERDRFVREGCHDDPELLRRVTTLLEAHHEAAGGFLPAESASEVAAPVANEAPGTVIGRYHVVERIGEGGMGVVYLAEQQEPVRRQVALKIVKLGMDTQQVVARFEAERQALALMDHPNIAKVLDGGATEAGRPYFVMELVSGMPITEFCAKHRLALEGRLELFFAVCKAIQHAHQKGIIHRDLKPSNVLVTLQDGLAVPKVIDFGVAKAINQQLTEKTLFTGHAAMIGTPAYMSPEQAEKSRLDVDTRSDIYSLGVLLYELLTGTPPFTSERLRSASYSEMQRIVTQEPPERPSIRSRKIAGSPAPPGEVVSVFRLPHSAMATDLDWIVLKCLEKDRNRRYETANGLAADVRRFLSDEPILARPPSRWYELQKTVQRHKVVFAATAVVMLALAVAGGISVWQTARATRERNRAERQLRATLEFINVIFTDVSPTVNTTIGGASANRILATRGQELLGKLQADAGDSGVFRGSLGRLLIQLAFAQGWVEGNTGADYEAGLASATEAIRLLQPKHGEVPDDDQVNQLAIAEMVAGFASRGLLHDEDALAHFRQMESWADRLTASPTPHWRSEGRIKKQWAVGSVGDVLTAKGTNFIPQAIAECYLPGYAYWKPRFAAGQLTNFYDLLSMQGVADSLGVAHLRLGQDSEALPYLREAYKSVSENPLIRFQVHARRRN